MRSARGRYGGDGRYDVHDAETTPEMDHTHMFNRAEAGPTPELRSPPKSLRKSAAGVAYGEEGRSGRAPRSSGVPRSMPSQLKSGGGGGRSGGRLSGARASGLRSAGGGRLSVPLTHASWEAALAEESGAPSADNDDDDAEEEEEEEEACAETPSVADDAFEDALESPPMPPSASAPLEVPPPKWEVGPATPTPVETHQLRLTPARVSRASQKVAGARSLRDDPGSYEAQWLASAKKSSNRKSILKSSSRYRPPSPSREAEAGAEAEAECASAHADDAFHSPASAAAGKVDVIMKNNRFPTGKRFASLEDAVLELVGHSKPW